MSSWTNEVVSQVLKRGGGWWGEQKIDFKMEADHDWTRLQGCAGLLMADM